MFHLDVLLQYTFVHHYLILSDQFVLMKNPRKEGKAIVDKDIKFVKKLLKKNPIIFEGNIHIKDDCLVEITNIRKYENNWFYGSNLKFVYEIDILVKKNDKSRWQYSERTHYKNRRLRSWTMEKLFQEELCYFNIVDFCISKISYE